MKFKSIITSISLLLISVFVLSACDLFGVNTPPPTPITPPPVETPEKPKLEPFSKHFNNKIVVSYTSLTNSLNNKSKHELIDYQLTTFTDNLVRRLLAAYGPGLYTYRETDESGEVLADLIIPGSSESYSPHTLSSYDIIVKPNSMTNNEPSYRNNTIGKLAGALQHGQWNAEHEIVEQYNLKNSMTSWALKLENTDSKEEAYNSYVEHYTKIKLDLAKIIANNTKTTGEHTSASTYEEVVNTIVNFNLTNRTLQKPIEDYVLNNVVGSSIKNQENKAYELAYELLIRQIVKTTLEVKEPNSQIISVWPQLNFESEIDEKTQTIVDGKTLLENYSSIKISPKYNTPITKLRIKIEAPTGTSINGLKMQVVVKLSNGNSFKPSTVFNVKNNEVFEIDLHKADFSGAYESFTNADSIELKFVEHPLGTPFRVEFLGNYDKLS